MQFLYRDVVGSTQDEVRALYQSGERGPLWLRAGVQTAGRGRLDRRWVSESGNLYATLLWPYHGPAERAALHGFAAAVGVAKTLAVYNVKATLKWPNDVLVGGAKISGMLIEREAEALLVGIGVNLTDHPNDTPYPATHLLAEMNDADLASEEPLFTGVDAFLARLSAEVSAQFEMLSAGFEAVRAAWITYAHGLGEDITVRATGQSGRFDGIDPDGALRLSRPDGTLDRVHAGDVSFG